MCKKNLIKGGSKELTKSKTQDNEKKLVKKSSQRKSLDLDRQTKKRNQSSSLSPKKDTVLMRLLKKYGNN